MTKHLAILDWNRLLQGMRQKNFDPRSIALWVHYGVNEAGLTCYTFGNRHPEIKDEIQDMNPHSLNPLRKKMGVIDDWNDNYITKIPYGVLHEMCRPGDIRVGGIDHRIAPFFSKQLTRFSEKLYRDEQAPHITVFPDALVY